MVLLDGDDLVLAVYRLHRGDKELKRVKRHPEWVTDLFGEPSLRRHCYEPVISGTLRALVSELKNDVRWLRR